MGYWRSWRNLSPEALDDLPRCVSWEGKDLEVDKASESQYKLFAFPIGSIPKEKDKEEAQMTKSELIEKLAQRANGINLKVAEVVVNTVFQSMKDALVRGDRIEIRGFGSIKVKHYASYMGRNPKTGETIKVPPKKLPFFKVGKELKQRVDLKPSERGERKP
jgi:integration host factor subunit beta